MSISVWIGFGVPLAFVGMWWVERRRPARPYPEIAHWARWGWGFFLMTVVVASAVPLALLATGVGYWRWWNGSALGWWGLPVGLLLTSLVHYGWHRAEHASDVLWRFGHQLHHSPTRVDMPGAYCVHPTEVVVKTLMGIAVNAWILGLTPVVAATVTTSLAVTSLFQHWNIHTPRWLGWFVARPEMHALHHERDVHARNYSDLPLWDLVFGTYRNPAHFDGRVGFEPVRAARLGDMLLMRDVHRDHIASQRSACCPWACFS